MSKPQSVDEAARAEHYLSQVDAFVAGAAWAVKHDPRVLSLIEALRAYQKEYDTPVPDLNFRQLCRGRIFAHLAAWEKGT